VHRDAGPTRDDEMAELVDDHEDDEDGEQDYDIEKAIPDSGQ